MMMKSGAQNGMHYMKSTISHGLWFNFNQELVGLRLDGMDMHPTRLSLNILRASAKISLGTIAPFLIIIT